jgi:hypothetical protein
MEGPARDARKSDLVRNGLEVAEEGPSRADQRRAALHAAMGDILKIVQFDTVGIPRCCDGRDRHPVPAMRGQGRGRLGAIGERPRRAWSYPGPERLHSPTDLRESQQIFVRCTIFVHCERLRVVWRSRSGAGAAGMDW